MMMNHHQGRGGRRFIFLVVLAIATFANAVAASSLSLADSLGEDNFDLALIDADALVIATIESMTRVAGGDHVEVVLADEVVVFARPGFDVGVEGFVMRPRLEIVDDDALVVSARANWSNPALKLGRRYLFLFQGGAWQDAPTVKSHQAIFEILNDETIACNGGQIFAVGYVGLLCGVQEREVGPPLQLADLLKELQKERSTAKARWPEYATSVEADVQPMLRHAVEEK